VANPVFSNTKQFQSGSPVGFDTAPQQTGVVGFDDRMTYEGTITKAASLFLLAAASAVLVGMLVPGLTLPISLAAFVMSLVVAFGTRHEPKPALMAITLALWGGAAGGMSVYYEAAYGGIIMQALIATAIVFASALTAFRMGWIRGSKKINKFLAIAVPAYVVFSLVNVAMVMFGNFDMREVEIGGLGVNLGLILSLFAIAIGALMLISDFDFVENGVIKGLPSKWEWSAAYGLVFAIIWIYIEMLRLLSYLRR
jgi:uncharacterized YccA/Bax inhibitor family protein